MHYAFYYICTIFPIFNAFFYAGNTRQMLKDLNECDLRSISSVFLSMGSMDGFQVVREDQNQTKKIDFFFLKFRHTVCISAHNPQQAIIIKLCKKKWRTCMHRKQSGFHHFCVKKCVEGGP